MSFPTISVEVGFAVSPSVGIFGGGSYLHLDDPFRGKLDSATLAPDVVWTDVTEYLLRWSSRRGATRTAGPLLRYEAGTASFTVRDPDRRFDPTNTTGPYSSGGVSQVRPMRAVRIRATHEGITYDLFRGYTDGNPVTYRGPEYAEVTFSCTDAVKVLSSDDRAALGTPIGAGEDSGARATRILDAIGWSTSDRVIAVGDSTLQGTTMDGSAWAELLLTQDSEGGEVYVDEAGRVVFRNRLAQLTETRSTVSQGTFGDIAGELPYEDVRLAYDDTAIVNLAQIARVGGIQQTSEDTLSRQDYLTHTHERTDLLLQTDSATKDYADWITYRFKDPELRFDSLVIDPRVDETALFPQVLGRQFGDRITVNRRPPGTGTISRDVFIRGVSHEYTSSTWKTTWNLQSAARYQFLVLDHATLGALDANALAY